MFESKVLINFENKNEYENFNYQEHVGTGYVECVNITANTGKCDKCVGWVGVFVIAIS